MSARASSCQLGGSWFSGSLSQARKREGSAYPDAVIDDVDDAPARFPWVEAFGGSGSHLRQDRADEHLVDERYVDIGLDLARGDAAADDAVHDLPAGGDDLLEVAAAQLREGRCLRQLTSAGFLMLGGRGADLFGRRRVFLAGLSLFTAASLIGGLAQSGAWLIAARAAQGLSRSPLAWPCSFTAS
jgi:hypothetical protein